MPYKSPHNFAAGCVVHSDIVTLPIKIRASNSQHPARRVECHTKNRKQFLFSLGFADLFSLGFADPSYSLATSYFPKHNRAVKTPAG